MDSRIEVACAATSDYLPHCATMLQSLLSAQPSAEVHIHLMHDGAAAEDELRKMRAFVEGHGAKLSLLEPGAQLPAKLPATRWFSRAAWFRVLLPQLLAELDRVLYLDIDLIVAQPLGDLWHTDLGDNLIGAVTNPLYPGMLEGPIHELGIDDPADYFNSGVMLMNLDGMRKEGVPSEVLAFAKAHPKLARFADQDPLNAVLHRRRYRLHPRWNAQATFFDLRPGSLARYGFDEGTVSSVVSDPAIVHFSGPWKPWEFRCMHARRSLYAEHRRHTPWPDWELEGHNVRNRLLRRIPARWQVRGAVIGARLKEHIAQLRR